MKRQRRNNKGLSLVEIIIVIAIMSILVAILVPNFLGYLDKARKVRDLEMARVLGTALERAFSSDDKALQDWNKVPQKGQEVRYQVVDPHTSQKYYVYNMFEWTLTEKGDIVKRDDGKGDYSGHFRNGILRDAHRVTSSTERKKLGLTGSDDGNGAGRYVNLWIAYIDELAYYDINIFYRKYNIAQYRIVKRADNGNPEVWVCALENNTEDGEGRDVHMYYRLWPDYDPVYMSNIKPEDKNTKYWDGGLGEYTGGERK